MPSTPVRGRTFRLRDRALELRTGEASFSYDLDGEVLTEQLVLPAAAAVPGGVELDRLLDVAHVAIGTSYFKVSAPEHLVFERPVTAELVAVTRRAYDDGLREFAVVNRLPVPLVTSIDAEIIDGSGDARSEPSWSRPLLPIGGGKDSAAVLSMLPGEGGVSIAPTAAQRRLTAAAGVELLEVGRRLDPRLAELTAAGGMNGHIPVTFINSAISALVAGLGGFDAVVIGNERSTNEPTRIVGGVPVNHQYSKSFAFEEVLAAALAAAGVTYFSLLRQLSGLAVAGVVAGVPALRTEFLSCNRAFRHGRDPDEPQRWCLECAKCLYTFLCFAPFLAPGDAEATFGGNPLAREELAPSFRDLWDPSTKPFDCVGEREESAVAMAWLARTTGWGDAPVVRSVAEDAAATAKELGASIDAVLAPAGPHRIPEPLAARVRAAAGDVRLRT